MTREHLEGLFIFICGRNQGLLEMVLERKEVM